MELPLNITLFISWFLGFIVNWSMPAWELKVKEQVANFAIVLVAFLITQFWITTVPVTIWGKVIYIACSVGFGFAPMTVYLLVTTWGLDYIKNKGKKKTDEEIQKP